MELDQAISRIDVENLVTSLYEQENVPSMSDSMHTLNELSKISLYDFEGKDYKQEAAVLKKMRLESHPEVNVKG